jgi:hypothetical protein
VSRFTDDALFDLYALDHRFYPFTDGSNGVDSVVYEDDAGCVCAHR